MIIIIGTTMSISNNFPALYDRNGTLQCLDRLVEIRWATALYLLHTSTLIGKISQTKKVKKEKLEFV